MLRLSSDAYPSGVTRASSSRITGPPGSYVSVQALPGRVLRLPLVERRAADPVLATHIRRRRSCLVLPQDPDDLLFRERVRFIVRLFRTRTLLSS